MEHRRVHQPNSIRLRRSRDLRREMTVPERLLWTHLRDDQLGVRFRRQYGIDCFIADFACPQLRLVIEIDGESHNERETYDSQRTNKLEHLGYKVMRFTNDEVLGSLEGVIEMIVQGCEERKMPSPQPSPRVQGEGGSNRPRSSKL